MPKELKKLMKKNDFVIHRDKKHLIWKHTDGAIIVTPKTPSDHRAIKNIMRDIKREVGFVYA